MDWLGKLRDGIALAQQARAAISSVTDAVKDGTAALSTTDQAELNRLLEAEKAESRVAHDTLEEAIKAAGG